MRIQKVTVTPQLAAEWLKRNVNNRPLSKAYAQNLAREMAEGAWRLSHQGLAFDKQGRLLDGQHRLTALVIANVPLEMFVALDCDVEGFAVLDCGRKRTTGDVLSMRGVQNAVVVAAMSRFALIGMRDTANALRPTRSSVDRFASLHHDTLQAFANVGRVYSAAVGAAFVNAKIANMRGVVEAGDRLVSLTFAGDGDPMRVLARRLRELKGNYGQAVRYSSTVTALRAVHDGRDLAMLKLSKHDLNVDHSAILAGVGA